GFVQKEIRLALDAADEQPEEAIFIIPLKLEQCEVPERLTRWQWVYWPDFDGPRKLYHSLRSKANALGIVLGQFSLFEESSTLDGITKVRFHGQLTLGRNAAMLRASLQRAITSAAKAVEIDLADVTYLDGSGFGELMSGYTSAINAGVDF